MKSRIEYFLKWIAPILSIFGYFQFLEPKFGNKGFWKFQLIVLCVSIILFFISKIILYLILDRYEFKNKNLSKLLLKIEYGDLFNSKYSDYQRVIPVDWGLDNNVDKNIRDKSVQAQFMKKQIFNDNLLSNLRKQPGRIIQKNGYCLLRVASFSECNHIELESYRDYFSMIYDLCSFMDNANGNRRFVCSVIGGNIRFHNGNLSSMQRLQLLKLALESYNFKQEIEIDIIVKRDWRNRSRYNLREL